ncbi:MAG: DinB family protein [Pirellulaceae bacterium]
MGQLGSMIADAASMGPRYAQRLVDGISADRFARFATPGGEVVAANHPAFIFGHLCLYPLKVVELLGGNVDLVTPPAGFAELFSKDAKCQDDPGANIYPPADQIMAFFESSHQAALEALRAASDEQLAQPNPVDSPMKTILPTLGSMLAFYMTGHLMTHLGQLSTWRRMEKLPPA